MQENREQEEVQRKKGAGDERRKTTHFNAEQGSNVTGKQSHCVKNRI